MAPTTQRLGKPDHPLKGFNKFGYWFAHPKYVTPAPLLNKLIDERHYVIQARVTGMNEASRYHAEYDDEGWLEVLGFEMSQFLHCTKSSVMRRLYDIRHERVKVCRIDYAEAICESFGMNMEIETDIPTLPGNKMLAADLVAVRAEMQGIWLDDRDLAKYAEQAWRLSGIIVRNPDRLERVQDMAPFDCLRNMR